MNHQQDVDQMLSEPRDSTWDSVKSALGDMSKIEKTGLGMAGFWGSVKLGPIPNSEGIIEKAPEEVNIGDLQIEPKKMAERGDRFFEESIWGHERNAESLLQEITLRSDKLGHYSVSYLGARAFAKTVDRFTEGYDPKKVALGGMAVVPLYVMAKEGYIEGEGFEINPESMDQRADAIIDTLGAAHSVYNYHKKRTAAEDEEPVGVVRETARKAGRTFEKARQKIGETSYRSRERTVEAKNNEEHKKHQDNLIGEELIEYSEVRDRGEMQNLIGDIAETYNGSSKNKADLENTAEAMLQEYGASVKSEALNRGYAIGSEEIVGEKLEDRNLNEETAKETLTAVANRYKLEYDTQDVSASIDEVPETRENRVATAK